MLLIRRATALLADRTAHLLARMRGFRVGRQIAGGVVLVVLGLAMITGQVAVAALWLLERMPAPGTIG